MCLGHLSECRLCICIPRLNVDCVAVRTSVPVSAFVCVSRGEGWQARQVSAQEGLCVSVMGLEMCMSGDSVGMHIR